ncbi:hypothetical protein WA026_012609 [Henosepilachna vigintioctopunctata]|uniref:Envelope protein n=2 Tax=Henosepilachna vigintioctopunctata TaxID=420089 RepID=A0AAW1U1C0_9CUCU
MENCIEIENELSKFKSRNKRAIEFLGSTIRFLTGNLDQKDLKHINNDLKELFKNQNSIITRIDKFTSFANHISNRYNNDIKIIQNNINTTMEAIKYTEDEVHKIQLVHYNILLSQKLLSIIKIIQRTITLALNNITNLEIISTNELKEITDHLKFIYNNNELLELDTIHLIRIIEFSKFKIMSIGETITCILYIPILYPDSFTYQRIYPIPNRLDTIIQPPTMYRLYRPHKELWTNEECQNIENQTLCSKKHKDSKCTLTNLTTCTFLKATNEYNIQIQLENNKILLSCKKPTKIIEECGNHITYKKVKQSALISANPNCKIIIGNSVFEDTHTNFTLNITKIKVEEFETKKFINLQQKHINDINTLKEEAEELELHNESQPPIKNSIHFSITLIILVAMVLIFTGLLFQRKTLHKQNTSKEETQLDKVTALYPNIPTAPQDEDVLT